MLAVLNATVTFKQAEKILGFKLVSNGPSSSSRSCWFKHGGGLWRKYLLTLMKPGRGKKIKKVKCNGCINPGHHEIVSIR